MKRIVCIMISALIMICIFLSWPNDVKAASTLSISTPNDWDLYSWDDSLKVKWGSVTGASGYYFTILNQSTGEYLVQNKYTTSTSFSASSYFPDEPAKLKIWIGAVTSSTQLGSEAFTNDIVYIYVSHEPGITNGTSSSITKTGATLKMSVDYDYGYAIEDCGFYIGTSSSIGSMEQYSFHDYSTSYDATTKGTKYMTITGLEPGTKYYYRAYAENEVGEDYTSARTFTTEAGALEDPVVTYPEPDTSIVGYQDIPFIWCAVDDAEEYTYYVKRLSGTPSYTDENEPALKTWSATVSSSVTHFTLDESEAIPGYWYKFVVKASADGRDPSWSDWVYCYLDELKLSDAVLSKPTNRSTVASGESITLKWSSVANADGYRYHIKQLSGEPEPENENESCIDFWSDSVSAGTTSYTFSGSNVKGGYWYKLVIEAYNQYVSSSWSDWCYVYVKKTSLADAVITYPANTASYAGYQSIKLDWDAVNGADGYRYHIKRLSGLPDRTNEDEPCLAEWVDSTSASVTSYSFPANEFIPGYWYKFVIEAYADGMNPSWSDWVYCYASEAKLADPVVVKPSPWSETTEGTSIVVDWNSVTGAEGYKCHYKQLVGKPDTSNSNELAVIGEKVDCKTTTKYTLPATKVIGGYWYKFVVEAYSSTATSSWSDWIYVYVPENGTLDRPVITSPKAIQDYEAGEDIMFAWAKVPNATNYNYFVKQLVGEPDYTSNEQASYSWTGSTGSSNRYFTLTGENVKENTWYKFVVEAKADGYDNSWSKYTYIHIPEREDWIHSVLGEAMTEISDEAFEGNVLLRTFDASNSQLETIGSRAFAACTNLQAAYLPMSVFNIADDAFDNCPELTIHCITGSFAEQYALAKGIPVEVHGIAIEMDTIQLSRTDWNIGGSDSAEAAIHVNSSNTWTASSDSNWLTLSTVSGSDGTNVILKASANTTKTARSATVTFRCGQASATVQVTQNASSVKECTMKLNPTYWEPSSSMLTREIVVQHEDGFDVSSNQSWLTYTVSNSKITAKVTANSLTSANTGILTVTCNDCGATLTVTVATKGTVVVPAPTNVKATSGEPHAVVVTWSAVSGASYILERSDDNGASWTQIASTSNTSYTDASNIGAKSTHHYRVTACKTISGSTVKSVSTISDACTTKAEVELDFIGIIDTIGDNGRAKLDAFTDVSWSTISGMTYRLSLKDITDSKNEYYVNGLQNTNVGATSSYSLSGLLIEGHKYRVWIGAFNSAGRLVGQTGERVFTVIEPISANLETKLLDVYRYTQEDSRWGNQYINDNASTKQTIAAGGCALTCVAMSERYRKCDDQNVNPLSIKANYSFSGNEIYWTRHTDGWESYSGISSGGLGKASLTHVQVMQQCYENINAGKPSVIGMNTDSTGNGNLHYVIVYGYKNLDVNNMKMECFLVKDPAAKDRQNLQTCAETYYFRQVYTYSGPARVSPSGSVVSVSQYITFDYYQSLNNEWLGSSFIAEGGEVTSNIHDGSIADRTSYVLTVGDDINIPFSTDTSAEKVQVLLTSLDESKTYTSKETSSFTSQNGRKVGNLRITLPEDLKTGTYLFILTSQKLVSGTPDVRARVKVQIVGLPAPRPTNAQVLAGVKVYFAGSPKYNAAVLITETLLPKFEPAFIAGILGNIVHEGNTGLFECSWGSTASRWKWLNDNHNYDNVYGNKSGSYHYIFSSGISLKAVKSMSTNMLNAGYTNLFGIGAVQWTDSSRNPKLLDLYIEKANGADTITEEQAMEAEAEMIIAELTGRSGYKNYEWVYTSWKNANLQDLNTSESAYNAGKRVCQNYEVPEDYNLYYKYNQRAVEAQKIYEAMTSQ